ncbi:MAG TPA: cation-translocating P-type ATPase [Thermoanaerobaculia bacterium]|nr:cation-translocating P-type ATPase [Thermoanaerobaculia bacterium]
MSMVPFSGLSHDEAAKRLRAFGRNELVQSSAWQRIRDALSVFADPMAIMLAFAAAVYFALGDSKNGIILLVALAPVLAIDVVLEARSRGALKKLAAAVSPRSRVVRGGAIIDVATEELVPGDIVVISEGDMLQADGAVRFSANLSVDESALTGESEPQEKAVESRFFAGSIVLTGHGFGEIEQTGLATQYGKIGALVGSAPLEPSLLQRKIHRMVNGLLIGAGIAAIGILAIEWYRGLGLGRALLAAISLAISAAPEEFLLVFTVFLTLGAWRLSQHRVLVRRLASVETLGATTVICTDKTGTLTRGRFELEEHVALAAGINEDDLLVAAVLACEPHPADTLEQDIVAHCAEHGIDVAKLHADWSLIHDYSFDPIGKHMAHVWEPRDGGTLRGQRIVAKGAIEGIVEHCTLDADQTKRAFAEHARLAGGGYRVLAVAGRSGTLTGNRAEDEQGLELYGLIGFRDPVRDDVPPAVAECQRAGIAVKLITGDHVLTAHAIATAAGIEHDDEWILTGDDLDRMPPDQLEKAIVHATIFARIRPEQKYAIVDTLMRRGEVVAMAGDGINDAPALRRASIGISMGVRGTQAARAAAGIVLLDDDFASIVATVRSGRQIFANIQRAFLFLVPVKIVVPALALFIPLLGFPPLLLPVHLVWLELIVHPVAALVFESEAAPRDVMQRRPRDPAAPLLERSQLLPSIVSAVLLAIGSMIVYTLSLARGEWHARSMAIAVLMTGIAILVLAARAGDRSWHAAGLPRHRSFWIIWLGVIASLPLVLYLAPLARTFAVQPLSLAEYGIAAGVAVVATAWRAVGARTHRRPS